MPIKSVFVTVTSDAAGRARLEFAADLARSEAAHLTGALYFNPTVPEVSALAAACFVGGSAEVLRHPGDDDLTRRAEQAAGLFHACLRRHGLDGEWHAAHWLGSGIGRLARLSDLVIAGQAHPEDRTRDEGTMVECLLSQSGRPVLVLPCHGVPPDQCRSVLVAWDGSREAARALHDAMPLLRQAHRVTVLSVERVCTAARQPDTDVVAHLARHGISVTVARVTVEDLAVSEVLLNHAADMGADLLVAGGYGHSRLREAVFGGVTRDLLRQMTIPVLFSH